MEQREKGRKKGEGGSRKTSVGKTIIGGRERQGV